MQVQAQLVFSNYRYPVVFNMYHAAGNFLIEDISLNINNFYLSFAQKRNYRCMVMEHFK